MIFFIIAMTLAPIAYFPIFGFETPFGVLSTSDFVMPVVYLMLLPGLFRGGNRPVLPRSLLLAFGLFAGWALLSTITIPARFSSVGNTDFHVLNGLLKLGKFVEYALFGFLLIPWLDDPRRMRSFHWSLLASTFILAMNSGYLVVSGMDLSDAGNLKSLIFGGANAISVLLAMLMTYWFGVLMSARLRFHNIVSIVGVMIAALVGIACTLGRGGWVALACGCAYYFFAAGGLRRLNGRVLLLAIASVVTVLTLIAVVPQLRDRVEATLDPYGFASGRNYNSVIEFTGVDDGGRLDILFANLVRMPRHLLLGTGFFHRCDASGVSGAGTHNFFLEMAMMTGLVGAALLAWIWHLLWHRVAKGWPYPQGVKRVNIIFRAAMVAITVGCFSGEYLYGGVVLSSLSALAAACVAESRLSAASRRQAAALPADLFSRRFLIAGQQPGLQT